MERISINVSIAVRADNPLLLFNNDRILKQFYEYLKQKDKKLIASQEGLCMPWEIDDKTYGFSCGMLRCSECKFRIYNIEQIDEKLEWFNVPSDEEEVYTNF